MPLNLHMQDAKPIEADWPLWFSFVGFYVGLDIALALGMIWLFHTRWRVSH